MKTLSVGSNVIVRPAATRQSIIRRVLLACGILASLLYLATTILGAMVWEGYSPTSQAVSELFAIDAPSRSFVVPPLILYAILIYAFGLGVWKSAGQRRALRVVAVLLVAKEILGPVATVFAPIHMRGVEGTLSDTIHGILTAIGVFLCMFPAIGFGAAVFGKRFRLYSIVTMVIFLTGGILAFLDVPRIAANMPTPWNGVVERTIIFAYLLWYDVLAIILLRKPSDSMRLADGDQIVHPEAAANRV